jgi:putative addiction module component (TIGR02574 family)
MQATGIMSISKLIEKDATQLSPKERAALADKLWLTLAFGAEVQAAWTGEIERRIRESDVHATLGGPR